MERASDRPRVVLHIGRNKAGSTTIQDYCLAHRGELAAHGVDHVPFGHRWDSVPGVPGCRLFEEVAERARAAPGRTMLVSSEFLSMWPDEYTLATRAALAGCEVRVLVYLRRCDDWLRSSYAEVTKLGMNARDIDAYHDALAPRAAAVPNLRAWAACFGGGAIVPRVLERGSLSGGDLLADFVAALGLAYAPTPVPSSNAAPHWCALELTRALTRADSDEQWGGADRDEVEPLARLMAACAAGVGAVPYLTRAQAGALEAVWRRDLAAIAALTGTPLAAAPAPSLPERVAVPSLALVPPTVMARFRAAAADPGFAARHPAAARRAATL